MDNANNDQQFVRLEAPMGSVREGGSPQMEIGHGSGIQGFGAGESQWLDSAASPGDIKIGTSSQWDPDVRTGVKAQLSVSVAAHSGVFTADNGVTSTYQPDADDHLLFKFNDVVVKDITLADFTDGRVMSTGISSATSRWMSPAEQVRIT